MSVVSKKRQEAKLKTRNVDKGNEVLVPLTLVHLQLPFVLISFGWLFGLALLVLEISYNIFKKNK